MKSAPFTVQGLVLLLPIGKVGWKMFTLSVFCPRIDHKIWKALSRKGEWLVSGS